MFIYNQIIICQEIIGSRPSVLCTNGKVHQKIDFQLVWLFRSGIMRKNIFVTHYYVYSTPLSYHLQLFYPKGDFGAARGVQSEEHAVLEPTVRPSPGKLVLGARRRPQNST